MSSGHWIRYKLFLRDKEKTPIYSNRDNLWSYEYLDSFYPQPFRQELWKEKFIEYICSGNIYTCELEEIERKDVSEDIIIEIIHNRERKVNEFAKLLNQYQAELTLLTIGQ